MYVIVVYDVGVERVTKLCHFLRAYLNWIQNSVFEGELTESEFMKIRNSVEKITDKNSDSVIFYTVSHESFLKKHVFGTEKAKISSII